MTKPPFNFDTFGGWGAPGWTQTPNELFALAPHLTESELRVLLHIIRQTYGWQKRSDAISISQLVDATGMSRRGVINGTAGLRDKRLIVIDQDITPDGDQATNVYSLRFSDEAMQEVHNGSARNAPPVGTKAHTQKKQPQNKKSGSLSKKNGLTEDDTKYRRNAAQYPGWTADVE